MRSAVMEKGVLEKALRMLEKHPLCDNCLGRQFALLGHGLENNERGRAMKLVLTFEADALRASEKRQAINTLKVLASNGFSNAAEETLQKIGARFGSQLNPKKCFLCEDKFETLNDLEKKALGQLREHEYNSFLVGTELSPEVEEREDEFKAEFAVSQGEGIRNEFGRMLGKRIAASSGKDVDYKKPDIVILVNPFTEKLRLQANPLFITGRYRKLVRGIPQSKWFCSSCRGKGCAKCNWTGKMYADSVEEIIERPLLKASGGTKGAFHSSGREDIDARMLGRGRPFVIEISNPKKRFLDLESLEKHVNVEAQGKVQVSGLRRASKDTVRGLKKGESTKKQYCVLVEFERRVSSKDTRLLKQRLNGAVIKQKTPIRVLHRRADLTREKYIYELEIKKLSPKKAEMKVLCQGGLYVKELVTGDEGRTTPSVSEILQNKAKPLKLDVLNLITED